MPNQTNSSGDKIKHSGFGSYAFKRIIVAIILFVAVVWILSMLSEFLNPPARLTVAERQALQTQMEDQKMTGADREREKIHEGSLAGPPTAANHDPGKIIRRPKAIDSRPQTSGSASSHTSPSVRLEGEESHGRTTIPEKEPPSASTQDSAHGPVPTEQAGSQTQPEPSGEHTLTPGTQQPHAIGSTGVSFVEAVIEPMEYELSERFWGWRPNDILNFTDNVNNFQLGVLEVTRRTVVDLTQRISRTGSADRFEPHLENAMNWLMVRSDRYWFPSPESKYRESIRELTTYKEKLIDGTASFHTRSVNIIPLLMAYRDLLGSCEENLTKQHEDDGSKVSMFRTDDYFYYAKGVASAMGTMLEGVHHDFVSLLEIRHAGELLHHAIESCHHASELEPWIITDSDLDGFLANHRANMAALISHARFFMEQLIETLST